MLQKKEDETVDSRSQPSIISGNANGESQTTGPVTIVSNGSESCAPLEPGGFLSIEESSSSANNNDSACNSQFTFSGVVPVNRMVKSPDTKQRAVKRGAERKQHDKEDGSVAISQGMEDITNTSSTSPGAVSVQGIMFSHNDSALEHNDQPCDSGTDIEHGNEVANDISPFLIVTARMVSENPLMPDILEEHLERRIQDGVESRLRAQQQPPVHQHSESRQPPIITTVVAEPIDPANTTLYGAGKLNPANRNETSCRQVWGLLLLMVVMVVGGAVTGVIVARNRTTQTTTATNSQLFKQLEPWIVRDNDTTPFHEFGSPQHLALDWLSLSLDSNSDSDNLPDSGPTLLERYVVAVLYYSTNGRNWFTEDYEFPLLTSDVCSWNNATTSCGCTLGISCGNQLNVESIYLDHSLPGTIPWELGLLSDLSFLSLKFKFLSGTIPTEIGQLTRLQGMYIYDNRLEGTLPTEIGRLTALTDLWFNSNGLTGTIPTELGHLTMVRNLYVEDNNFHGTVPTELGLLTGLEDAWLNNNSLTGTVPSELGLLTNLYRLSLYNNNLTGTLPTELGRLTGLGEFSVEMNGLTGSVPMSLSSLINLTSFWFHQNDLTGSVNNIFCTNGKQWNFLESDCLATNGKIEIQCDCCTSCCNANGMNCQ